MRSIHLLVAVVLALSFTGCLKTREQIAREKEEQELRSSLRQNVVQAGQGVEQLQAEIGRLQGRMEEMEHRRQKEISGLNSNREGSEKNMVEIKNQLASMQQAQAALFEEIKRLKEDNLQLTKALAERPRAAPAPAPSQKKSAATAGNFDAALKSYLDKDFDEAIDGFREYLDANPKGKKANSAHYYLGDSLYRKKDFTNAIVEFAVVHEKAPATTLGRKSTLKIAESFKAMGKDKDAKAFAQILVQSSPDSSEGKQAKKLLK